jgi:hypothetical protein
VTIEVTKRAQAVGDPVEERRCVRRFDDAIALATAQVEPHVPLVLRRVGEGDGAAPVDAAQLQPSGEVERDLLREHSGDLGAKSAGDRGPQPPDRR